MESTFELFLISRNIDSNAFHQQEPEHWQRMKELFEQVSPESFLAQKNFDQ